MERKKFYDDGAYEALLARVARLEPDAVPEWGKMSPAQACAHCAEVAEVANGKALVGSGGTIGASGATPSITI